MKKNIGTFESANEMYIELANRLMESEEIGPRGLKTKELINTSFELTDPLKSIITLTERDLSIKYIIGELLWYLMGKNDLNFISNFSNFWTKLSDDNITCNSAYGHIIQNKHNINQLDYVIEILKKDKDTRRAIVVLNTPFETQFSSKDVPCTMNLQFLIRDNKLSLFVNMRSNDFNFGLPYDIIYFTLLQEIVFEELLDFYPDLKIGTYTHHSISTHVYEKDYDLLKRIANSKKEEK